MKLKGRVIYGGCEEGEALVTSQPLSFYGGVDAETGVVTEKGHELEGKCVRDKILVFPFGKGSTVGSYILYQMKKRGVAPLAIVNRECETIVAVGAVISEIPCVDKIDVQKIRGGSRVKIDGSTVEEVAQPTS